MAAIANLAVQLTAITAPFTKNMQQATKSIDSLRKTADVAFGAAQKIAGLAGIGFGVGGAVVLYDRLSASVENLVNTSKDLQTTIVNTQALRFAAERSGQSFDTVSSAVKTLTENLGQALQGSASANEAFLRIGLRARELQGMSSFDLFGKVIDQLRQIKDPAAQSASSIALLGKKYREMSDIIEGGSAGIAAARQRIQELGLGISDVDATAVKQANTAVRESKLLLSGVGEVLITQLAPYIRVATDELVKFVATMNVGADVISPFVNGIEKLKNRAKGNVLGAIGDVAAPFASGLEKYGSFLKNTFGLESARNVDAIAAAMRQFKKDSDEAWEANKNGTGAFEEKVKKAREEIQRGLDTTSGASNVVDLVERQKSIVDGFHKAMEGLKDRGKRAREVFEETRTPLENYKDTIAELNELLKAGAINQDTFARASKQAMDKLNSQSASELEKSPLVKGLKELLKLYEEGKNIAEEVATPVEKVADKVNRAFELLNKGAIDGETFDRYIKKLQKDLMDSDSKPKDPRDNQSYQQTGSAAIAGYLRNVSRGTQINGMRVSGPSSARTQVHDPQLKEAINYLKQITDNTADNTAVAA